MLLCKKGLPEGYLARNDNFIGKAEDRPPRQSIEDIDKLLAEAGLLLSKPEADDGNGMQFMPTHPNQPDGNFVIEW